MLKGIFLRSKISCRITIDDLIFSGKFQHNLKVAVNLVKRPITLHCHKTRPLILIGNNHTLGRLQLLSVTI